MTESKEHVLIVEDDMAMLFALERLFQSEGWQVSSSRTIEHALTQLESPPDWIVLDLGLIDGSGEEVLRYVREAGMPSRVAVVSGHIDPSSVLDLKPWKPDVLLPKPIHFEDLLAACEALGSENRQPPPTESPKFAPGIPPTEIIRQADRTEEMRPATE